MNRSKTLKANAKINIFLKVCGKYENGYHRLYSLFQEISICDEITVETDDSKKFDIELSGSVTEDKTKDLCYKAAKAFWDNAGIDPVYTKITSVKNTPSQAGLGGGSSDAAAVLLTLQEFFFCPIPKEDLNNIAAKLGADVPFFLYGNSALCEGIGEIVRPVPSLSGIPMILMKPSEGVSTGICFNKVDSEPSLFDEESYRKEIEDIFFDGDLTAVERLKKSAPVLTNDLQAPAIELVPVISDLIGVLSDKGAFISRMSGSGSAVFGVFEDEAKRNAAYEELINDGKYKDILIIKTSMI